MYFQMVTTKRSLMDMINSQRGNWSDNFFITSVWRRIIWIRLEKNENFSSQQFLIFKAELTNILKQKSRLKHKPIRILSFKRDYHKRFLKILLFFKRTFALRTSVSWAVNVFSTFALWIEDFYAFFLYHMMDTALLLILFVQ